MKQSKSTTKRCSHCDAVNASYVVYCRSCSQPVKSKRQANIIRYHVSFYLDGERFKIDQTFADHTDAQKAGIAWRDSGPVARTREARIGRTVNDQLDRSFSETFKYDNYKQRRRQRLIDGNCETCKGKGRIKISPAAVKVRCKHCNGAGMLTVQTPVTQTHLERPPVYGPVLNEAMIAVTRATSVATTSTVQCEKCQGTGYRASTAVVVTSKPVTNPTKGTVFEPPKRPVEVTCPECHGLQRDYANEKLTRLHNHLAMHPTDTRAVAAVHREREKVAA